MAPRNLVLWSSLECSPPCQGGGRGFKSRQDRVKERAPHPSRVRGPSHAHHAAALRASTATSYSADAPAATRTTTCGRCHHLSFQSRGTYGPPATSQFNMCNCTPPRGAPQEIRRSSPKVRQAHSQTGSSDPTGPHGPTESPRRAPPPTPPPDSPGPSPGAHLHHQRPPRPHVPSHAPPPPRTPPCPRTKRSRWTRRSPARSTTHPCDCLEGPEGSRRLWKAWAWALLGQEPASLRTCVRTPRHVGGTTELPGHAVVQASVRCCGMPASRARTSASR